MKVLTTQKQQPAHTILMWDAPEDTTNADVLETKLDGHRLGGNDAAASRVAHDAFDPLLARYFADVRRFPLLSRNQEQALWRCITQAQKRMHRALYTSPVALPTLIRLWHQVNLGEIPLKHVVQDAGAGELSQTEEQDRLSTAIVQLQDCRDQLQGLRQERQDRADAPHLWREMRQRQVRLWHQWYDTFEALHLHANVYETMQYALQAAHQSGSHTPALRAAYSAWSRAQRQYSQAKQQMLRANLRLVIRIAKRYCGYDVPLLDLIQEGNLGLMHALDKFDPHRGVRFITYATWWVRQTIQRAAVLQSQTIRLPDHIVTRTQQLRATRDRLGHTHGGVLPVADLSQALGWTSQQVEDLLRVTQPIRRLHDPTTDFW